ncbi:MAG: HEPN domain-containing protein [Spirochaetes bacterium]|nr:MAG: HEPN domain-containing protein [Spirochaetota bacterium]
MTLNDEDRRALVHHRLQKAEGLVQEVQTHINNGHYVTAVNRIYYGIFHALSALALQEGFTTSKHLQLIGWFNKRFVKEGAVDRRFGRIVNTAFEMRTRGDYDDFIDYQKTDVVRLHEEMKDFIAMIAGILR